MTSLPEIARVIDERIRLAFKTAAEVVRKKMESHTTYGRIDAVRDVLGEVADVFDEMSEERK